MVVEETGHAPASPPEFTTLTSFRAGALDLGGRASLARGAQAAQLDEFVVPRSEGTYLRTLHGGRSDDEEERGEGEIASEEDERSCRNLAWLRSATKDVQQGESQRR